MISYSSYAQARGLCLVKTICNLKSIMKAIVKICSTSCRFDQKFCAPATFLQIFLQLLIRKERRHSSPTVTSFITQPTPTTTSTTTTTTKTLTPPTSTSRSRGPDSFVERISETRVGGASAKKIGLKPSTSKFVRIRDSSIVRKPSHHQVMQSSERSWLFSHISENNRPKDP